jgi:phosphate transport system protein
MREQFDRQLVEMRQEVVAILRDVDVELHDAVDALVEGDREKAKLTKKATKKIDQRCEELEDEAYQTVTLQQPVASDLRLIQFIVYADFNLQRMSNHARNIAKTAKRASKVEVPGQLLDLLASMAHLVYRVLGALAEAIVEGDIVKAATLSELDDPVDDLYKEFYHVYAHLDAGDDVDAAIRVLMAARMLERISDNAVEMGERAVFLFTGKRMKTRDLRDLDEAELRHMYVAPGRAITMGMDKDRRVVDQIPEVKLPDEDSLDDFREVAAKSLSEFHEQRERRRAELKAWREQMRRQWESGFDERSDADSQTDDAQDAAAEAEPTPEEGGPTTDGTPVQDHEDAGEKND